jgi:hypothetical protein
MSSLLDKIPELDVIMEDDTESCTVHQLPGVRLPTDSGGGGCTMRSRIERLERNDTQMMKDLDEIKDILGSSPDHARGTPGTGMARTLSRIAEVVLKDSYDEGEDTLVQSRSDLLTRVRHAEAALEAQRQADIERNKLALESGKLKIERWKLVLGILSVVLGPGVVSFVLQHFFK